MLPVIASGLTSAYQALPSDKKKAAVVWLKRATGGAVDTVSKLAGYAQKSEATAAVVAEGLVRSGAPAETVAKLFDGTPNASQVRTSILNLGRSLIATEDASRPGLNASNSDTANDVLRAELVKSVVRAFGSVANARKIQMALFTLREEDFNWFEALQPTLGR